MTLINNVKEVKKLILDEQKFIAEVIDNEDPLKLARVRVRVRELFGTEQQIPNNSLPWAVKEDNHFLGKGSKQFSIPSVGSLVSVYFSKGDIYSPVYTGEIQSKENYDIDQEEDYGNLIIKKDRNQNTYKNNLSKEELELSYNGKVIINISKLIEITGLEDLEINISGNLNKNILKDENISVSGNSSEVITNNKNITALKISLISNNTEVSGDLKVLGNVEILGNLSVTGETVMNSNASINGKDFSTHVHTNPEGGNTGPVV